MFDDQAKMFGGGNTQLSLQGTDYVLNRRPGVVFERFRLSVLQKDFEDVGHRRYAQISERKSGRLRISVRLDEAGRIWGWGRKLTGNRGAPLTQTLSANRTRDGLVFNLARLLAESKVDLRAPCCSVG